MVELQPKACFLLARLPEQEHVMSTTGAEKTAKGSSTELYPQGAENESIVFSRCDPVRFDTEFTENKCSFLQSATSIKRLINHSLIRFDVQFTGVNSYLHKYMQ